MNSVVELHIPGRPEYVRVARLAISGVASCVGFSVDQIDEIKQSVGEACSSAVTTAASDGGVVTLRCQVETQALVIEISPVGFRPDDIKKDERTEFQFFLIKTLMDDVELVPGHDGRESIRMTRSLAR